MYGARDFKREFVRLHIKFF